MLVEVKLLGALGQRFGRKYRLDINTPAEAFRALAAQLDGFLDYLYEAAKSGVGWQVVDDDPLGMVAQGLDLRIKTNRLIIAPRVEVGDGVGRIIGGLALIAFSFLVPGGFLLSAATFGAIGAKLVLDGLSQLLTPTPDNRKADSETLGQAAARGYQGLAVPILYGKCYINDIIPISATVYSEDIPLGVDGKGSVNWGGGGTAEVDPYPSLTKMLLHFDLNLTDAKGNTAPISTQARWSSDKKVFGSYSLALAGFDVFNGGAPVVVVGTALDMGTSSATIEGQFYVEAPHVSNSLNQSALVSRFNTSTNLGYYWIYDHTTLEFRFVSDAFAANWAYTLNTASPVFRHLALCVDTLADTVNMFVDGVPLGSIAYPGTLGNPGFDLMIGASSFLTNGRWMRGYIDELRVSIGIARYAATFTAPTSAFANS